MAGGDWDSMWAALVRFAGSIAAFGPERLSPADASPVSIGESMVCSSVAAFDGLGGPPSPRPRFTTRSPSATVVVEAGVSGALRGSLVDGSYSFCPVADC